MVPLQALVISAWPADYPRVIELIGQAPRLGRTALSALSWLRRVHDVGVAVGTIQRIFRDLGLSRLRRTPKWVRTRHSLAAPGLGCWLYRRLQQSSSLAFLGELC